MIRFQLFCLLLKYKQNIMFLMKFIIIFIKIINNWIFCLVNLILIISGDYHHIIFI